MKTLNTRGLMYKNESDFYPKSWCSFKTRKLRLTKIFWPNAQTTTNIRFWGEKKEQKTNFFCREGNSSRAVTEIHNFSFKTVLFKQLGVCVCLLMFHTSRRNHVWCGKQSNSSAISSRTEPIAWSVKSKWTLAIFRQKYIAHKSVRCTRLWSVGSRQGLCHLSIYSTHTHTIDTVVMLCVQEEKGTCPLCILPQIRPWLSKTVEWRLSCGELTQSEPVGDEDERVQIFCPRRAWTITWTVCKWRAQMCCELSVFSLY